ncbi:hypothetical protein KY285_008157 [Solanum tuberosum]|nr:hypothetical protein KY285_008157 [Solanum tuberosum]
MIFNQGSGLENKIEQMWLHLSYGIVISLSFNEIDAEKYVSLYESDITLLLTWLYLNLEDNVFIEEGSIVVITNSREARKAVGPKAKPRSGPRISQPNNRFAWDPG